MTEPVRSADQSRVLDDVRRALGRSETLRPAPLAPFVEASVEEEIDALVARFVTEATAVGARIHRARDSEEAVALIAHICEGTGIVDVALSGSSLLAAMNLPTQLAAHKISVFDTAGFAGEKEPLSARLAATGAGVTAADFAIAETGSIVLSSDEENALLVSLLPPLHIALIPHRQVIGSLTVAISKLAEAHRRQSEPCRSTTFITGPSRTSDVELTLSIGVHGPKELHLILVAD